MALAGCCCSFLLAVCILVVPSTSEMVDQSCNATCQESDDASVLHLMQLSNSLAKNTYPQNTIARRSLNQNPFEEVDIEHMSRVEIEDVVRRMQAPWQEERRGRASVDFLQRASHGDQPHTEVQCIGPSYNVTCKFKNLYFVDSRFTAYFPEGVHPPKEMQSILPIHRYGGADPPTVLYSSPPSVDEIVSGTTLYYHTIWHQNIGHFLWDGLYPAYVALTQWGVQEEDFNSVVVYEAECSQFGAPNDRCISEDIMKRIGGEKGKFFTKGHMQGNLRFDQFIMGSGHKGARTFNRDYSMWGERDLGALRSFRDRLYRVYGLNPPPRRNSSLEHRQTKRLRAVIIGNKRYTSLETDNLKAAAQEVSALGETVNLHVDYIDYGDTRNNFTKQLELLQNADIHMTGPGTGMSYLDFMPDGSVHVALGMEGAWPWNDRVRPYSGSDVSFMEEYWAEGNTHVRALFYPIKERRKQGGLTKPLIKSLLDDAALLIRSDFKMPVEPGMNLSPVGQTFKAYCYTVGHDLCDRTLARMNGDIPAENCDAWPDGIVWEAGGYSEAGFKGYHCEIDRKALRELRKRHVGI